MKWNGFKLENDTVLNSFLKTKMVEIRIRIGIRELGLGMKQKMKIFRRKYWMRVIYETFLKLRFC